MVQQAQQKGVEHADILPIREARPQDFGDWHGAHNKAEAVMPLKQPRAAPLGGDPARQSREGPRASV